MYRKRHKHTISTRIAKPNGFIIRALRTKSVVQYFTTKLRNYRKYFYFSRSKAIAEFTSCPLRESKKVLGGIDLSIRGLRIRTMDLEANIRPSVNDAQMLRSLRDELFLCFFRRSWLTRLVTRTVIWFRI